MNKKDYTLRILLVLGIIPLSVFPNLILENSVFSFRIIITLSSIVATLCFLGAYKLIYHFISQQEIKNGIWIALLCLIVSLGQYNLYWGFIRNNQAEYQVLRQVMSEIPRNFEGKLYFDLPEGEEIDFTQTYGEFGSISFVIRYALQGMSLAVSRDFGLQETLFFKGQAYEITNNFEEYPLFVIDLRRLIPFAYPYYGRVHASSLKNRLKSWLEKKSSGEEKSTFW